MEISYKDLNSDTQLIADIVGMEAALRLARALGSCRLTICDVRSIERGHRLAHAARLVEAGMPVRQACHQAGITEYQFRYHSGQIRGRGPAKVTPITGAGPAREAA